MAQNEGSVTTPAIARRERQQLEVVTLVVTGERVRASALGREHLQEFPADELVRLVLEWAGLA